MYEQGHFGGLGRERPAYRAPLWVVVVGDPTRGCIDPCVNQMNRLADLSAFRDRLRAELASLDNLIGELEAGAAADERRLDRFRLGEVWGATKLGRYLGVSRNTAHKAMQTELADVAWYDEVGRLRVNAADVEQRYATKGRVA